MHPKQIKRIQGYKNCHYLLDDRETPSYASLYKYLNLDRAIQSISNSRLYFSEPNTWSDKFESRFYHPLYHGNICPDYLDAPLFIGCFTERAVNEASWRVYSYGKQGLGSKCVQLKLNRSKLRRALETFCSAHNSFSYEGRVQYVKQGDLLKLHYCDYDIDSFSSYFRPFVDHGYISLFLLKREFYDYEKEFRFILASESDEWKGLRESIEIPISWADVIQEIRVDSSLSESEQEFFKYVCRTKARIKIQGEEADKTEGIPFVLFDVGAIPEKYNKPIIIGEKQPLD